MPDDVISHSTNATSRSASVASSRGSSKGPAVDRTSADFDIANRFGAARNAPPKKVRSGYRRKRSAIPIPHLLFTDNVGKKMIEGDSTFSESEPVTK